MADDPATGESRKRLPDDLTMRCPTSIADIKRVARFNGEIFGPSLEAMTVRLLTRHPRVAWEDLVYVEDSEGNIISTLLYVPVRWNYGCTTIEAAEMSLVATRPSHRHQGLVRMQVGYYEDRMRAYNAVLSAIQGIPYFYRQFGYDYALPLEGGWQVSFEHLNKIPSEDFTLRPARLDDCSELMCLWREAQHNLTICVERDAGLWCYLLANSDPHDAMGRETIVVEDKGGRPAAYFCLPHHHFGQSLTVSEASNMSPRIGSTVLRWLAQQALNAKHPGVRLNLPDTSDLVRLAKAHGAYLVRRYAWQILIPSRGDFLRAIVPELERRLSESCFGDMTGSTIINFYEDAYQIVFKDGRIVDISASDPRTSPHNIAMPPQAFLPLAMGTRTPVEVQSLYPDMAADGEQMMLLETLFPKCESFVYAGY